PERALRVARVRFPWLLLNMLGALATGFLLERFEAGLSEALFLLTFVPVIMATGGNLGSQTATIAVRSLATGRINSGEHWGRRFLWQAGEGGVALGGSFAL